MKIDSTDFGVFTVKVSQEDAAAWLVDPAIDLEEVNGAIDDAASHAGAYGKAIIVIEIAKTGDDT